MCGRSRREISLDREGFAVLHQQSAVRDFWDEDEVRRIYYPEAERVIAEAHRREQGVHLRPHAAAPGEGCRGLVARAPRQPATRVHVDHTANSGPQRVRDFFGDEAEASAARPGAGDQPVAADPWPAARCAAGGVRCRVGRARAIWSRPTWCTSTASARPTG